MPLFAASTNVSYDYRFLDRLSAQIGFGTAPFLRWDSTPPGIPLMIDYLGGSGNGYFGTGGGKIILPLNYPTIYPTVSIGYRHQPVDGGIIWRQDSMRDIRVGDFPLSQLPNPDLSIRSHLRMVIKSAGINCGRLV